MRKYIHTILCTVMMFILASCGHAEAEIQPEKVEVVEIATEGEKVAEIVTERVPEATEASTEIVTTEKTDILSPENDEKSANSDIKTDKKSELPGRWSSIRSAKRLKGWLLPRKKQPEKSMPMDMAGFSCNIRRNITSGTIT